MIELCKWTNSFSSEHFHISLDTGELMPYNSFAYAALAQLVEQLICNQQVVGSSPTSGSKQEAP